MFSEQAVTRLYREHREALKLLVALEKSLTERFFGMEDAIRCMSLAAMTGESMLMIGPPGTAKSRLVRSFCHLCGLLPARALMPQHDADDPEPDEEGDDSGGDRPYFEYLLTQFTEPSELFGFFDLGKLFTTEGPRKLVRDTKNMMQKAEVVFLDEVFNASSAILNSLLTFMNERKFHDRGRVHPTPMRLLFAASNHTPREDGLGAVYDRFLLRCRLDNVSAGHRKQVAEMRGPLASLIAQAWNETHRLPPPPADGADLSQLLPLLDVYRDRVDGMTADGTLAVDRGSLLFADLADLVVGVRRAEASEMSNRRLVKFAAVILAQALLRAARTGRDVAVIEQIDLIVLLHYGLDRPDEHLIETLSQHLGASG